MKPSLQSLVAKWAKALQTAHASERDARYFYCFPRFSHFYAVSSSHCDSLLETFRKVKASGREVVPTEAECIAWMSKREIPETVDNPSCAKVWGEVGVQLWSIA
jgi:hypothetical protein